MSTGNSAGKKISSGASMAVKLVMLAVVAVTILLVVRIVLVFFEQLRQVPGYNLIVDLSEPFRAPLDSLPRIATPYGTSAEGAYHYFDVAATVVVLALMFVEYVLAGLAGYFERQARGGLGQSANVQINFAAPPPAKPSTMASDAVSYGVQPKNEDVVVDDDAAQTVSQGSGAAKED